MKKFAKKLAIVALAAVAAVGMSVGLAACGGSGASVSDIKTVGYYQSITPADSTDIYSTIDYYAETITLYNDGTYVRDIIYTTYLGIAYSNIDEFEDIVYGTYEITDEDEYGVAFTLSAATDLVFRYHMYYALEAYGNTADSSSLKNCISNDVSEVFTDQATDTADFWLSYYSEESTGWEITYDESHINVLTLGKLSETSLITQMSSASISDLQESAGSDYSYGG